MPVRKTVQKSAASPGTCDVRTGQYSLDGVGAPYRPVQPLVARPAAMATSKRMHTSSTRDLKYFFDIAQSLYRNAGSRESSTADPMRDNPPSDGSIDNTSVDPSAVLVMWLFRRTLTQVLPVAERFHLGPADRQPLYSLTSQPSIRSAREFNELVIKRRDPIIGAWHSVCISDIEPCLDLTKTGSWRVSTLVMDSVPVWKKVVSGQVIKEEVHLAQANKLRLTWGDRAALGPLGDAYGLWWEGGVDSGMAEAFYIVERWGGFDSAAQGMIEVSTSQESHRYRICLISSDKREPNRRKQQ